MIIIEIKYTVNVMLLIHSETSPSPQSMEKLSSMKPVPGPQNTGDCCCSSSYFLPPSKRPLGNRGPWHLWGSCSLNMHGEMDHQWGQCWPWRWLVQLSP